MEPQQLSGSCQGSVPTMKILADTNLIDFLVDNKLSPSRSEAKRLIGQGAVKVNEEKISDLSFVIKIGEEYIIQAGKRKFIKIEA